jgi:hypothetical protein
MVWCQVMTKIPLRSPVELTWDHPSTESFRISSPPQSIGAGSAGIFTLLSANAGAVMTAMSVTTKPTVIN